MADELLRLRVKARKAQVELGARRRRARVRVGQAKARAFGTPSARVTAPADECAGWEQTLTEIVHLPPTATPDEITHELTRAGAVVIDNLVEPELMDQVASEMAPFIEANGHGLDDYGGRLTKRTGALIRRSPSSHQLLQHPTVLGTVGQVLAHSPSYQINLTQIISVCSGEPAQKIHRDHWTFGDYPFRPGAEVQCSTMWAMDDFTEANGATRVIPGSNHAPDRMRFRQRDTIPAEMTKGSVMLYTGSVYHGGGANTTASVRNGLNLTYIVGWLRQEENQYLATPPQVAADLPEDLLLLMGYQECGVSLGYVDDLREPLVALQTMT